MTCLEVYDPIVISSIYDLERMCWSGASQRIAEVLEMNEEKQEAFLQHVIDYGEMMGEIYYIQNLRKKELDKLYIELLESEEM